MGFFTLFIVIFGIVIFGFIFYIKSIKFFHPSEIVAVPSFKENTGQLDEDANPVYSYFRYQKGGRMFIPFYKNYFVLPTHLLTSHISTQKFLTLDQIYIKVDFVIQYHIDVDSAYKIKRAFELFEEFVKDKATYKKKSKVIGEFSSNVEHLFRGVIPEVLGKMRIDDLMENRDRANQAILKFIRKEFKENGLTISGLKIEYIHIKNRAYLKKIKKITDEKQEIELIKEQSEIQNDKSDFYEKKIKIEKNKQAEKFAKASAKIEFGVKVKKKKIEQNLLLMESHKDKEVFNKSEILTKTRAEKEASFELEKVEFEREKLKQEVSITFKKVELQKVKLEQEKKKVVYETSIIGQKKESKPKKAKIEPKTTTQKLKEKLHLDNNKTLKNIKNIFSMNKKKKS